MQVGAGNRSEGMDVKEIHELSADEPLPHGINHHTLTVRPCREDVLR